MMSDIPEYPRSARGQATHGRPTPGDDGIGLVMYRVGDRTFYYARLFVQQHSCFSGQPRSFALPTASVMAVSVMLGHVPDGSSRFVLADTLYTGWSSDSWGALIDPWQFPATSRSLAEALALAASRLAEAATAILVNVQRWIERPTTNGAVSLGNLNVYVEFIRRLHLTRARICQESKASTGAPMGYWLADNIVHGG